MVDGLVDRDQLHDRVARSEHKTASTVAHLHKHLVRAPDGVTAIEDGERLAPAAMANKLVGVR